MSRVRRSDAAKTDLKGIWRYIAGDNRVAADRFLRRLNVRFRVLAYNPHMGRLRSEFGSGLHSLQYGNYVIFYLRADTEIEIVRVLHGARDIDALFQDELAPE